MATLHVFLCFLALSGAELYDFSSSNVFMLTGSNFERQVTSNRDKYTSIVHFYRETDGKSETWSEAIKELANDWQGVYLIYVVNCDLQASLCETQTIREYPTLKVYPPFPAPALDYPGEMTAKAINNFCARYVNNKAVELNENNSKSFLEENPSVPKVILFTEKQGFPTLWKGLSVSFDKKMSLGIARSDNAELVKQFKIKKFPSIVVHRISGVEVYNGELKYRDIFDWLNVFSETFVSGGETETSSSKPWMSETVPLLQKLSANDLCYQSGALCGIYFAEEAPGKDLQEISSSVVKNYAKQASVRFMWVDVNKDPDFVKSFDGVKNGDLVYLKIGKRNRFVKHDGELTQDNIDSTVNKIIIGDAKFVNIKGKLPELNIKI